MLTKEAAKKAVLAHSRTKVTLTKQAGFGSGRGDDQSFESSFSNLAHAFLRDRAPSLLDHEIGFQLLDRNDDNTKAVGVVGLKVGSQLVFAPFFFLQGEIKGHELLYLKNSDVFVPAKENWINYLLNRKPTILGEGVTRSVGQLGVQQPDMSSARTPPTKMAAAYPSWLGDAMPALCHAAKSDFEQAAVAGSKGLGEFAAAVDLKSFIKQASLPVLEHMVRTFLQYPKVAAAFDQWYGLDSLTQAIRDAGERQRVASVMDPEKQAGFITTTGSVLDWQHPIKTGALKIRTYDPDAPQELHDEFDEEEQEKLLKEKVLIKDERDPQETSVEVAQQSEQKLFNPTETGLYLVLTKPGKYEKCFIACQPFNADRRQSFCTVVRVGDTPNWKNTYTANVWCGEKIEGKDYDSWFDGLKDANSLSAGDKTKYILVGPRGHCTCPFNVEKEMGSSDQGVYYEVDFRDYADGSAPRPALSGVGRYETTPYDNSAYNKYSDGQRLHLNAKGGTALRASGGDVWVPNTFKLLSVEPAEADSDSKSTRCCQPCDPASGAGSKNPPIQPGNISDVTLSLIDGRVKTAFMLGTPKNQHSAWIKQSSPLKLFNSGTECQINAGPRMRPLSALISLVRDHGLTEKNARDMLKRAEASAYKVLKTRIKYAEPYMTDEGPNAPAIPEQQFMGQDPSMGTMGAQTTGPQDWSLPVPEMSSAQTDPSIYDPRISPPTPMDMQTVQQAASTGQKEVFDTAMLGQMLKAQRDDTMVDRYLPQLMSGMDALGRILFSFYWHGDKFADRYGQSDMPELEDSLRNAFEQIGDVILFLKQKTVEPSPEEDTIDLGLNETQKN